MAYFCKKCGVPVSLLELHGVLELSIERGDKMVAVDKCPICDNPLNTRADLKYVKPIEKEENHEDHGCCFE